MANRHASYLLNELHSISKLDDLILWSLRVGIEEAPLLALLYENGDVSINHNHIIDWSQLISVSPPLIDVFLKRVEKIKVDIDCKIEDLLFLEIDDFCDWMDYEPPDPHWSDSEWDL